MPLPVGQYYPRIGRGAWNYHRSSFRNAIVAARQQFHLLCDQLETIFTNIEPVQRNAGTYGHTSRNLLILACTEFEAQCTEILQANSATPTGRHFNTNDYVKLCPVMRLDAFSFSLRMFPDYPPISPFAGWNASQPTQSLTWYNAYNLTKHDREANFGLATLENAILSVSACYAILIAQIFGEKAPMGDDARVFKYVAAPTVNQADRYSGPATSGTSPSTWTPVNFAF